MKLIVDGTALNFETHGDLDDQRRPWVVLSHSLACDRTVWAPQIDELRRRYRVLAMDTRGHGDSEASPPPYTLDRLADDVAAILRSMEITRPHFVGMSLGGLVGQTYALRSPSGLASLTLADTTSHFPSSALATFADRAQIALTQGLEPLVQPTLARWFTPTFRERQADDMRRLGGIIRATSPEGFAGCAHAVCGIDTTDRLHEITCPILIIVGSDDAGTPPAMAREIHEHAPGSQLAIIDGAAHLSSVEQPAVFNQLLLSFLDQHN